MAPKAHPLLSLLNSYSMAKLGDSVSSKGVFNLKVCKVGEGASAPVPPVSMSMLANL